MKLLLECANPIALRQSWLIGNESKLAIVEIDYKHTYLQTHTQGGGEEGEASPPKHLLPPLPAKVSLRISMIF